MAQTCTVAGCDDLAAARGLCHSHYTRQQRYRDPCAGGPRRRDSRSARGPCEIDGCTEPGDRYVLTCGTHFRTPRAAPRFERTPHGDLCSIAGCERPVFRRGWCAAHHSRWRRTGDPVASSTARGPRPPEACQEAGCGRPLRPVVACRRHRYQIRRHGRPRPDIVRAPAGAGTTDRRGYRRITIGGRVLAEHRYVMEQVLGRALWPDEDVHHRNGDRADNRPENLEVWSTSQPRGQRAEDKVEWAREMLRRYAPDLVVLTSVGNGEYAELG